MKSKRRKFSVNDRKNRVYFQPLDGARSLNLTATAADAVGVEQIQIQAILFLGQFQFSNL